MSNSKPSDVTPPTITVQSGWPPTITGELFGSSSNGPPAGFGEHRPPDHSSFLVQGSGIRQAESSIMDHITSAANKYEALRQYVNSVKGWVFSRPSPNAPGHMKTDTKDSLDAQSSLDNTMLGGADAIHLAGTVVNQLDSSIQMYAHADKSSLFPSS